MEIALPNMDSENLIHVESPEGVEGFDEVDNDSEVEEGAEMQIMNDLHVQVPIPNQIINMNDKNTRLRIWSTIFFIIFIADMIYISHFDRLNQVIIAMTADICLAAPIIFMIEINKYIRFIVALFLLVGSSLYIALMKLNIDRDCSFMETQCVMHYIETKIFIVLLALYFVVDIWKSIGNNLKMRILCLSAILGIFTIFRAISIFLDINHNSLGKEPLYSSYVIAIGYAAVGFLCFLLIITCNEQFGYSKYNEFFCIILISAVGAVFTFPALSISSIDNSSDIDDWGYMMPQRGIMICIPTALMLVFDMTGSEHMNINKEKHRYTFWSIIYIIVCIAEITAFISLNLVPKEDMKNMTITLIEHAGDTYGYYTASIIVNVMIFIGSLLMLVHFHIDKLNGIIPSLILFFMFGNLAKIGVAIYGMTIWCTKFYIVDNYGYTITKDHNSDQCRMPFIAPIIFSSLYGVYLVCDFKDNHGNKYWIRIGVISLFLCCFGFVNGINASYYDNKWLWCYGDNDRIEQITNSLINVISAGYLLLASECAVIFVYIVSKIKSIQLISNENKPSFHKCMALLLLISVVLIYTMPWMAVVCGGITTDCAYGNIARLPAVYSITMCVPAVLLLIYDLQYV